MSRLRIAAAVGEPAVLKLVLLLLAKDGHDAEGVGDGESLVALCRASAFDAVVSDLRLPGLGGFAAAGAIGRSVPFVLMSGSWSDAETRRAEAMGAVRLHKPFDFAALAAAVRAAASRPAAS